MIDLIRTHFDRLALFILVLVFCGAAAKGAGDWATNGLVATLSALVALMTGRTGRRSTDDGEGDRKP